MIFDSVDRTFPFGDERYFSPLFLQQPSYVGRVNRGDRYSNFRRYPEEPSYDVYFCPGELDAADSDQFGVFPERNLETVVKPRHIHRCNCERHKSLQRNDNMDLLRAFKPQKKQERPKRRVHLRSDGPVEDLNHSKVDDGNVVANNKVQQDENSNDSTRQDNNVECSETTMSTAEQGAKGESSNDTFEQDALAATIAERMSSINEVIADANELQKKMEVFEETSAISHKQYVYFEEMLTKCLLRLDCISTEGVESVRLRRKETVQLIDEALKRLENLNCK